MKKRAPARRDRGTLPGDAGLDTVKKTSARGTRILKEQAPVTPEEAGQAAATLRACLGSDDWESKRTEEAVRTMNAYAMQHEHAVSREARELAERLGVSSKGGTEAVLRRVLQRINKKLDPPG